MKIGDQDFNLIWNCNCTRGKRYYFAVGALLIILLLSYGNSFHSDWAYDDYPNIITNKNVQIKDFSWDNIKKIHLNPIYSDQLPRPVAYFSFAVNYYFGGLNVFGYHFINFLVHLFSSIFLFLFIINTLKLPLLKDKYEKHAYSIALLATIFWAINPVQITAVTLIVQRMASMAGLFYIMSMYFYLKFRTSFSSFKYVHIFSCLTFAAMAIGTKENAVMLPMSIFLYDLFLIQGLTKETVKRNIKIIIVPLIVLTTIVLLSYDFSSIFKQYKTLPFTMEERLLTESRVILFYISLLFYPLSSRLVLLHDMEMSKSLLDPWTTLVSIIAILLIIATSVAKAKKWPLLAYCILFFFLNHVIESSFIPIEPIYEYRNYLPSMLLFIPLAIGLVHGLEYFSQRKAIFYILLAAIPLIIIVQSVTVYMQNNVMKDALSLWGDNVKKSPRLYSPHHGLGHALFNAGRWPEALEEYEKALQCPVSYYFIKKDMTYRGLGEYYLATNNYDKSIECFKKSIIDYQPPSFDTSGAFSRLAYVLMKKGRLQEAEKMVQEAILLVPLQANYYVIYSEILNKKKQPEDAIKQAKKALELDPYSWKAYRNIADAYKLKNNNKLAQHFLQVSNLLTPQN